MTLSPCTNTVLVLLFALALSGALWTAWIKTPLRPRVILAFLALMAMAAVDAAFLINQKPPSRAASPVITPPEVEF